MKYLTLESVVNAYTSNAKTTSSKFWGIIAILSAIKQHIIPGVTYGFSTGIVSQFLEDHFCFRNKKNFLGLKTNYYVMFSNFWVDKMRSQMCSSKPRFQDVICWYFRNRSFPDAITSEAEQRYFLDIFSEETGLTFEQIRTLFSDSELPVSLSFSDVPINDNDLLKRLSDIYGNEKDYDSINAEGCFIKANPGEFARAPFIQTIYASQQSTECLFLTQFPIPEYYSGNYKSVPQMEKLINEPLQQIFYGAPGTGKSFTIDDMTDDENSVRTTFHPDSDYASFVGAYKPTMENVEMSYVSEGKAKFAEAYNGHPGTEKKIVYKFVPQAFLKAYVAAWSDLTKPYFLIIEEINRGNCAQIFGDLFQLLDRNNAGSSSYAIHADEDISQFLKDDVKGFAALSDDQKDAIRSFVLHKDNGKEQAVGQDILDGKLLLLPPNLYIWATMNTSDQSLFPIDSAFKRRWNWKYMPIEYRPLDKKTKQPIDWKFKIGDNLYSWGQFLGKINPEIYTLTESSDKQMGYFFAKADNATGIISEEVFLNKVLFYLWTDVFKDFDVSSELFKNKEKNRSFRFTDFFEDEEALGNFIANFDLDIVDIDLDSIEDEDSNEDESTGANPSQRDRSKYSINGEGRYNKRQTVLRSLRRYVEAHPSMTSAEIIDKWKTVNPEIPFFILSSSEYADRINEYPAQRDRYWSVKTGTDEKVYITNQWGAGRITNFIDLINSSDFNLHIEKVAE